MGELTIEQMCHILNNAPEWAKGYNTEISQYVRSCWFSKDIPLSSLKSKVDQYYYGQSEEEELKQYAVLSQEKIEGGAMLVGNFNQNFISKCVEYQDVIKNQQSKIEGLEKEKSLQEITINQISQANQEWQRLNDEKELRINLLDKQIADVLHLTENLQLGNQLTNGQGDYGLDLIIRGLRGESV